MEHELAWGWLIVVYLYLAGMGAGAVTVSTTVLLRGPDGGFGSRRMSIARYGALIGPLPVILGTTLLIFDLGRPFRAFNLFKVINLSPMNFGAWMLMLFSIVAILYAITFIPWKWLDERLDRLCDAVRTPLALVNAPLGVAVAIYTAVLLGAMPSRPLWNSPMLAMLFLVSALSTGLAAIMLAQTIFHKSGEDAEMDREVHQSTYILTVADAFLIVAEFAVVILFLMYAYLTVGDPRYAISILMPGGEMAQVFWLWFVGMGLLLPVTIETFYIVRKVVYGMEFRVPLVVEIIVPLAILAGGLILRYAIVYAGQLTGPVGL